MHASTRSALIRLLTWAVIVPVALFLVAVNTLPLPWADDLADRYTLPLVVGGFGVIYLVQSLKDQQREDRGSTHLTGTADQPGSRPRHRSR